MNQNAPLEVDLRPRREAETLAAAGYAVTLVGGCTSPQLVRELTAPAVHLELYAQPRDGAGVAGQIREQSQAMARALRALARASRRMPVAAVHAGNPPDNFFLAGRVLRPLQGSTPRFVFDQHDAAPVLLAEKFPRTPLAAPLTAAARAIERRSFAAAGLVVFANDEYRARADARGPAARRLRGRDERMVAARGRRRIRAGAPAPTTCWRTSARSASRTTSTTWWTRSRRCARAGTLRVVVAGSGSALAAVRARARERGVAGAFEWLGFVRERERIAALVRAADVCVAPEIDSEFNRLATFVKIVEYMSAAAPVVAHRLPQTEALAGDTIRYASDMTRGGARRRRHRTARRPAGRARAGRRRPPPVRRADRLGARRRAAARRRLRPAAGFRPWRVARRPGVCASPCSSSR